MVGKCVAAFPVLESLVCMPVVLFQVALLQTENTEALIARASSEAMRPLLIICSHISLTLQTCKLVCAVTAFYTPSDWRFLHFCVRHGRLPYTVFFMGNVVLLLHYGLRMIAYLSMIMSMSSTALWLQQKMTQVNKETQVKTDWVAEDTKNGQLRTLVYSSDLECFGTTCNICLEELEQGVEVKQLRCNHVFHDLCLAHWYQTHRSCPLRCELNGMDSWKPSGSEGILPWCSHAQVACEHEQHEQHEQNQGQNANDSDSQDESLLSESESTPGLVSV